MSSQEPATDRSWPVAAVGDQFLLAALHGVLYESLLAENQRRLRHLDGAMRHLDQRIDEIRRRTQAQRQEEIIEEIEVILLNTVNIDASAGLTAANDGR